MIVWAIRNLLTGAYHRDKEGQVLIFATPVSAANYIMRLPKPELYTVVVFRR